MLTLRVSELAEVTQGVVLFGPQGAFVNGVAIDSREVAAGSAFVAFRGERADGHRFLPDAIEAGARALVVTSDDPAIVDAVAASKRHDVAVVRVSDALAAVQALAAYHRSRLNCEVVAVTGSTGKTTTKDLLAAVLATGMRVVATSGNHNNELGVPLTLLDAAADTDAVVIEMAMRGIGQIEALCGIARPTAGVVTNVGQTHIELLGTQQAIAMAKGELVGCVPETGRVFLNGDDAWAHTLAELSRAPVTYYGMGGTAEVRAEGLEVDEDGRPSFDLVTPDGSVHVAMRVPGRHNAYNAAAAAAVGLHLGLSLEQVVEGLEGASVSPMRMEVFESASGVTVVNDAYNANPTSMRAALRTLADMRTDGKRIAVLGDMAELGSLAELAHFALGEYAASLAIDVLVTVGEKARRIAEGARVEGMAEDAIRPCATAEEASEVLDDLLAPGDVILVKASRTMKLERVVEGIIQPHV